MNAKKLAGAFLIAAGVTIALSDDVKNNVLETFSTDFAAEAKAERKNDKGAFDITIYDHLGAAGVLIFGIGGNLVRKKEAPSCDHKP